METIREKSLNGSSVVEMSYIMCLFFAMFVVLIHAVFYYHDKVILNGAAAETAVLGAQENRDETAHYDLEGFFIERTRGKLIYMTDVEVAVDRKRETVAVTAKAQRSFMKLDICQRAVIAKPEKKIRQMERIT